MGAISRWLDRFCYKHPRLGIPGLMKYIVIANVAVYLMDMFSNGYFSAMLRFYPALIMEGQVWRLLTFIFVPTSGGFILWFALTTLFYYYIGNALENQWGSTRFTVFYGVGVLLNIFTGMVTYWISGAFLETASMYYVNMSMFFSFASAIWMRLFHWAATARRSSWARRRALSARDLASSSRPHGSTSSVAK